MSDEQVKRRILDAKKLRDGFVQRLVEYPWDSETAMRIIGTNEVIRTLWFELGNKAKYEKGMSPYLKDDED